VTTLQLFLLLGAGSVPGFFVGRWTAEIGRARHDMTKTWNNRQDYRS
jgi:hypothetical protein